MGSIRTALLPLAAGAAALVANGARFWLNRWVMVPIAKIVDPRRAVLALALVTVALMGTGLPAQAHHQDTAPSGLSARIVDGGVMLRWSAPAEGGPVDGYEILRRRANRGEQSFRTLVPNTSTTDTAYTDKTATEPGVRYTYRVKAIRGGVRSPWSHYATVLLPPYLVSNIGQPATATAATITQQHATGFRLGSHGQGYEISSVLIDLAAAPTDLTVSLWIGSRPEHSGFTGNYGRSPQRKLFDFVSPNSFTYGLNRFTAPAGAFAYANVNYFIVLSGFGASLSITETSSNGEDPGSEPGAAIENESRERTSGGTRLWIKVTETIDGTETVTATAPTSRANVLRLAVEGKRRDRGVLASSYGQPWGSALETVSVGDDCCFEMTVGAADRYLIRGMSVLAGGTTGAGTDGGFFGIPFELQDSSETTLFGLSYASAQGELFTDHRSLVSPPGISEWAAPRGATVAGSGSYTFHMVIDGIPGDPFNDTDMDGEKDEDESYTRRGGIIFAQIRGGSGTGAGDPRFYDTAGAPGVTFTDHGDVTMAVPQMAIHGEPLHAMVSTLGQDDSSFVTIGSTYKVLSQGFTTGSNPTGYRLQGIGVEIEGSDSSGDGIPRIPSGASSVSVAVHTDSNGQPGTKLFDLVSPDEYAADALSFFEAPPETTLEGSTPYVLVWSYLSGTHHRLHQTTSNSEDSGKLTGFNIADVFHRGASLTGTQSQSSNTLQMAVYGEAVHAGPPEYQVPKDWLHIPDDVKVGDRFRVAFVTFSDHRTTATSGDVEDYNAAVREQAAQGYNDRIIRGIAPDFRAVVCTKDVDARTNTGMTDSRGVPVHWLDGGWDHYITLFANTYDEFYGEDGGWDISRADLVFSDGSSSRVTVGAYSTGNTKYFEYHDMVWTGCDAAGAAHPKAHMGTKVKDQPTVAVGTPGKYDLLISEYAPLGVVDLMDTMGDEKGKLHSLYAISPVLTVVPRSWELEPRREPSEDFDTLAAAENTDSYGIHSDGETMFVLDWKDLKVYAYDMSTKARDTTREFNLDAENRSPVGLWSDGETMWVGDWGVEDFFAYTITPGADFGDHDSDKHINVHWSHDSLFGLWSDGETMWVADWIKRKVYAYTITPGADFGNRDTSKEFDLVPDNDRAFSLWSDGDTMWVGDDQDQKLYAYKMAPRSVSATETPSKISAYRETESSMAYGRTARPCGRRTGLMTRSTPTGCRAGSTDRSGPPGPKNGPHRSSRPRTPWRGRYHARKTR